MSPSGEAERTVRRSRVASPAPPRKLLSRVPEDEPAKAVEATKEENVGDSRMKTKEHEEGNFAKPVREKTKPAQMDCPPRISPCRVRRLLLLGRRCYVVATVLLLVLLSAAVLNGLMLKKAAFQNPVDAIEMPNDLMEKDALLTGVGGVSGDGPGGIALDPVVLLSLMKLA
eukprot:TRINITY_DN17897_c0_g1_i1.p1 TRINITY_DN17897_c0_g1~~TRINITY_DN17897_c0_g1_i1.p1  ORF type:complete len:171 (-),score=37.73 TRINITY_DN17897_c0_g1_i1:174-686(-)